METESLQRQTSGTTAEIHVCTAKQEALENQYYEEKVPAVSTVSAEVGGLQEELEGVRRQLDGAYKAVEHVSRQLDDAVKTLTDVQKQRDAAVAKYEDAMGQLTEEEYLNSRLRAKLDKLKSVIEEENGDMTGSIPAETQAEDLKPPSSSLKRSSDADAELPTKKRCATEDPDLSSSKELSLGNVTNKSNSNSASASSQKKSKTKKQGKKKNKNKKTAQPEPDVDKEGEGKPEPKSEAEHFSCLVCCKKFSRRKPWRQHTAGAGFKCSWCNGICNSGDNLMRHLTRSHCISKCLPCGTRLMSFVHMRNHYAKMHPDLTEFKCGLCSETVASSSALWDHEISHSFTVMNGCTTVSEERRSDLTRSTVKVEAETEQTTQIVVVD